MPTPPPPPFERPHFVWFVVIVPAMALVTALAFVPAAQAAWTTHVTSFFSPWVLHFIGVGAWLLHAGEALFAHRLATQLGLQDTRWKWTAQTFLVGFPSLRLLVARRAKAADPAAR